MLRVPLDEIPLLIQTFLVGKTPFQHQGQLGAAVAVPGDAATGLDAIERQFIVRVSRAQA